MLDEYIIKKGIDISTYQNEKIKTGNIKINNRNNTFD